MLNWKKAEPKKKSREQFFKIRDFFSRSRLNEEENEVKNEKAI